MLINIEELKSDYTEYAFSKFNYDRLERKLASIENLIRETTHNHFYKRNIKTKCTILRGVIYGDFSLFKVDDTIELYNSGVNDGLYVIANINDNTVTLDKELFETSLEMDVIKVEYPLDIVEGAIALLDYDLNQRPLLKSKRGIVSESISRHSVSYVQNANTLHGYPSDLLSFLNPYIEWRT